MLSYSCYVGFSKHHLSQKLSLLVILDSLRIEFGKHHPYSGRYSHLLLTGIRPYVLKTESSQILHLAFRVRTRLPEYLRSDILTPRPDKLEPVKPKQIKAKTDSLTFSVAGKADATVKYVNETEVTGTGASGDEWGPA